MLRVNLLRALLLGAVLAVVGASSAHAAVADGLFPIYDASDGVTVVRSGSDGMRIHFGPKAATLYKSLAGKHAAVGCGDDGGIMQNPDVKLAKRRGSVEMWTAGDYCVIETKQRKDETRCLKTDSQSKECVRVVVAATDAGRAFLDTKARTYELGVTLGLLATLGPEKLQQAFGADAVALAGPDASPPAGKVGYWVDGKSFGAVVTLADGTRRFAQFVDDVYSTNDLELSFLGDFELTLL